jgi:tRNA dimethylallyltransferase
MNRCDAGSNAWRHARAPSDCTGGLPAWTPRRRTGRPLTDHFSDTASPLPEYEVTTIALQIPPELTAERVARRVHAQFAAGILDEIRGLLLRGVPETALPFTGLVYRQCMEHLRGIRDEPATRELIIRENRKYSRRQLIWFRKEPNLRWIHAAGEQPETIDEAVTLLRVLRK